ncbi:hypothetical protein Q3G72_008744 [Acer saccharum]|nr:hypothetical protein Q3G72_008744 [Acer saccharum]
MNCDASIHRDNGRVGLSEAVAILRGIELPVGKGLVPILVETDALCVVNLIGAGSTISSDVGLVIGDIMAFLHNMHGSKVVFAPRTKSCCRLVSFSYEPCRT